MAQAKEIVENIGAAEGAAGVDRGGVGRVLALKTWQVFTFWQARRASIIDRLSGIAITQQETCQVSRGGPHKSF